MILEFFQFFAIQFLAFWLLCWNYRAISQARFLQIALSDLFYLALHFTVIKRVAESEGTWAMAGYICGGVLGSLGSVWFTRRFLEKRNA